MSDGNPVRFPATPVVRDPHPRSRCDLTRGRSRDIARMLFVGLTLGVSASCAEHRADQGGAPPRGVSTEDTATSSLPALSDTSRSTPTASGDSAAAVPFECVPREIKPGDTLVIRMPLPHWPYLRVERPDGESFYLAFPHDNDDELPPLIRNDRFLQASELRVPVDVTMRAWSARPEPQRVFAENGAYEITLGENLEADDDTPRVTCVVTYSSSGQA